MIVVWIFFGILLLALTALAVAAAFASLLILGSTVISLSFKPSRTWGILLLCSSFAGACLGALILLLLAPLFRETPSSISGWAYLVWAMFGYALAGTAAGLSIAGIQAVLLPLNYLKRSRK